MKKTPNILICVNEWCLSERAGGPHGYLWPYWQFFSVENKSRDMINVSFLAKDPVFYRAGGWKANQSTVSFFNSFDIICFHSTQELFLFKNELELYKGIVVLQSHCPKPFFLELVEDCSSRRRRFFYRLRKWQLEGRDRWSFNRADVLIFPCDEAQEPYLSRWPFYRRKKFSLFKKTCFIPTGIRLPCPESISDFGLRSAYKIPQDAIVFLFIGRHIKTKGYDKFLSASLHFAKEEKVYFVACGDVDPALSRVGSNVIEVGRTKDIYALIKEADYVCSLNEQTYFDLSVLEFLAMGKSGVISLTGGNKHIARLFGNLLNYYTTVEELYFIIESLIKKGRPKAINPKILKIAEENFSADTMISSWVKLMLFLVAGGTPSNFVK